MRNKTKADGDERTFAVVGYHSSPTRRRPLTFAVVCYLNGSWRRNLPAARRFAEVAAVKLCEGMRANGARACIAWSTTEDVRTAERELIAAAKKYHEGRRKHSNA